MTSIVLPAVAHSVPVARAAVEDAARDCGLGDDVVGDVRLAVSEAVTNAVIHGAPKGDIRLEAHRLEGELLVLVSDQGQGIRPRPDSPGLGLGLPIIAALADRLELRSCRPGTELWMAFPCPDDGSVGERQPAVEAADVEQALHRAGGP